MMNIVKKILSFPETVAVSAKSKKAVWLLRHSMRESLTAGLDPGLTCEGKIFAQECGTLLAGIDKPFFGASPRLRCIETVKAIMEGGNYGENPVATFPELHDTALFDPPDALGRAVSKGNTAQLLAEYYSKGTAPEMIPLEEFSSRLLMFLQNVSDSRNTVLTSHDIIVVSLLLPHRVYGFQQDDWCGYVQGAFLFLDENDVWNLAYTLADTQNRKKYQLFI